MLLVAVILVFVFLPFHPQLGAFLFEQRLNQFVRVGAALTRLVRVLQQFDGCDYLSAHFLAFAAARCVQTTRQFLYRLVHVVLFSFHLNLVAALVRFFLLLDFSNRLRRATGILRFPLLCEILTFVAHFVTGIEY